MVRSISYTSGSNVRGGGIRCLNSRFSRQNFGLNEETMLLAIALILMLLALGGGTIVKAILRLTRSKTAETDADPRKMPKAVSQQRLRRPDGSELHIEFYGPEDGIPIVLTHGWGLDSREWNYLKRDLSDRFRLIVWDEPGLGRSTPPTNRDYSLKNLARDLEAVLALAGDKPSILLGHSIGGMITLTFCGLFASMLRSRIMGIVTHSYDPVSPVT